MGIRWRRQDIELLRKSVKNFNAKLKRFESKTQGVILPERVYAKSLKENIVDRNDFNETIKNLKSFTKMRGLPRSEFNNNYTKWEIDKLIGDIKKDNRRKKKFAREHRGDVYYKDKLIGRRVINNEINLEMRSTDVRGRTVEEIQKLITLYNKRNSAYYSKLLNNLKLNYLKSIENFRGYSNYDEVITTLESFSSEYLYDLVDSGALPEINDNYFYENAKLNWNKIKSILL